MQVLRRTIFCCDLIFYSEKLKRIASQFSDTAILTICIDNRIVGVTSRPVDLIAHQGCSPNINVQHLEIDHPTVREEILSKGDLRRLDELFFESEEKPEHRNWKALSCAMPDSRVESLALSLNEDQCLETIASFFEKIWLVLREDCIAEMREMDNRIGEDALLWMASDRIDMAIFVVDRESRIVNLNAAAKELLNAGDVLKCDSTVLKASSEKSVTQLATSLRTCMERATDEPEEEILFLDGGPQGSRVPLSLSRYYHMGQPTELAVAMIPMPPDPQRVEFIGRKMGLTASEARVAALMQSGLTNREAAIRAGLKEQTFNTYAKRVLCKLNVAGRTEMAQLLTWQAAGRRIA